MHPVLRVVVTELRWNATGAPSTLLLNVSTWVLGPNPGAHAGPMATFASCVAPSGAQQPCSAGGLLAAVSRAASNTTTNNGGPHPVWAGLATAFSPPTAVSAMVAAQGGSFWATTAAVSVPSGGAPVILVTAEAEAGDYGGADPSAAAAALASQFAVPGGPQSVAAAASAWWADFWARSSVTIGDADAPASLPEAMWWGAQVRGWAERGEREACASPPAYATHSTSWGAPRAPTRPSRRQPSTASG